MILNLKEEDEINNYLELDENLFKKNSEISYENTTIYILHYPNADKVSVSYGFGFKKEENNDFIHKCHTEFGSSGGPILNLSTNKVIGIHIGTGLDKNKTILYNYGKLLKYPLLELNKNCFNENEIVNNILDIPYNDNKFSFPCYIKIPITGLVNLGDTSYFNAVLRLLATSQDLANYFINPKNRKNFEKEVDEHPLAFVIHRLFLHFYPMNEKEKIEKYKPETQLIILGRYIQIYTSKEKQNPNILLHFILDILYKELNNIQFSFISKPIFGGKDWIIKEVFNNYIYDNVLIKSEGSLKFHWFYWNELKCLKCPGCFSKYFNFNNNQYIELDFQYIHCNRQYKYPQGNGPIPLIFLLERNFKNECLTFCPRCQSSQYMDLDKKIYSAPPYLIFSLKRYYDIDTPFLLENIIDLNEFIENKSSYSRFELQGIISISLNENYKYVYFGKSIVDKQWYLYNDDTICLYDLNYIFNLNTKLKKYIPLILLYKFTE